MMPVSERPRVSRLQAFFVVENAIASASRNALTRSDDVLPDIRFEKRDEDSANPLTESGIALHAQKDIVCVVGHGAI